ncbi:hypothetical protein TNCV_2114301 [Trichonephila clavipes]|nr:hypothetical protein TNCV_2114301 [Trichonephila clavipes]
MSSRHHIDDFMHGRIIEDRRRAKNNRCCQGFDIAHSVVSRLWKSFKTTGMCIDGTGGGVLKKADLPKTVARRLRGGGLYARRPVVCPIDQQQVLPVCNGVVSITIGLNRDLACVLFSDESRFSLSSDCRRQLIWRESGTAYRPENIQEKDRYNMQHHGVGRHHDQWPHAPTCGCEWDYDGPTILMKFTSSCSSFPCGMSVINWFFMDITMQCHRTLAVQVV